jgi:hypothetical protein
VECKWSSAGFEPRGLRAIRHQNPDGENWVVAADVRRPFKERDGSLVVEFLSLADLAERVEGKGT